MMRTRQRSKIEVRIIGKSNDETKKNRKHKRSSIKSNEKEGNDIDIVKRRKVARELYTPLSKSINMNEGEEDDDKDGVSESEEEYYNDRNIDEEEDKEENEEDDEEDKEDKEDEEDDEDNRYMDDNEDEDVDNEVEEEDIVLPDEIFVDEVEYTRIFKEGAESEGGAYYLLHQAADKCLSLSELIYVLDYYLQLANSIEKFDEHLGKQCRYIVRKDWDGCRPIIKEKVSLIRKKIYRSCQAVLHCLGLLNLRRKNKVSFYLCI